MPQNVSTAVMARRHEPPDSLDYFPTPPWATRALCEHLDCWGKIGPESAWDPACGEGHMVRPLTEYFPRVEASDVHDYGYGYAVGDFLAGGLLSPWEPTEPVDWIITNPPFNQAAAFVRRGLELANVGICLLVRTSFLEGIGRHATLFEPHPPEWICQFTERVPMIKGRLSRTAATATAYCWIVWVQPAKPIGRHGPGFVWLPPCRKRLERDDDYLRPVLA